VPYGIRFRRRDYSNSLAAFVVASLSSADSDVFALVTDGLTEVFDTKDAELGLEGIKNALAGAGHLPLKEVADRVVTTARAHGVQLDDQTLLLIKRL
jgi:serine phosphatase RsbU (regulator of sigma subunit)